MESSKPPKMLDWTIWEILNRHFYRYTTKKDKFKIFKHFDSFEERGQNSRHWGMVNFLILGVTADICLHAQLTKKQKEYQLREIQEGIG